MPDSTPPTAPVSSDISAAPAGPSNLRLRVIYGVLGAALLLGSVWFSPWTLVLPSLLLSAGLLYFLYQRMTAPAAPTAMLTLSRAGVVERSRDA